MKARYAKLPLPVAEQVKLLEKRGMIVADPSFAAKALSSVSYYRLSAYSYPFRANPDTSRFRDGTTFERVWRYYRFDRRLKNVVLDGVERVEIATRTKIVNWFTQQYGAFGYRDTANFAAPVDKVRYSKTLTLIDDETMRSNEEFVAHFRKVYDTSDGLPLWMATELMTFGNMLTFFRMLKMKDKKAIAREFGLNADTFETWLKSLNFVRNVCAHHGRLWNRHLAIAPGIPVKDARWHEKRYPIVPSRIYSILCILKQLIDVIAPQSGWKDRLFALLADFPDIHRLSMAIPTGFEKSALWKEPEAEKNDGADSNQADPPNPEPANGDSAASASTAPGAK